MSTGPFSRLTATTPVTLQAVTLIAVLTAAVGLGWRASSLDNRLSNLEAAIHRVEHHLGIPDDPPLASTHEVSARSPR